MPSLAAVSNLVPACVRALSGNAKYKRGTQDRYTPFKAFQWTNYLS
jgi:hypothetical protein